MELHFPEITFSAAHYIPGHETCGGIHGHTYFVRGLTIRPVARHGPWVNFTTNGMLIDFGVIKKYFKENWDHKFIVPETDEEVWEGIPTVGPGHSNLKLVKFTTCEWMANTIQKELRDVCDHIFTPIFGIGLFDHTDIHFTLYEGPNQGVKV